MVLNLILGSLFFLWGLLGDLRNCLILGALESGLGNNLELGNDRLWLFILIWSPLGEFMVTMGKEASISVLTDAFLPEIFARLILFPHDLARVRGTRGHTCWLRSNLHDCWLEVKWFDDRLLRWLFDHILRLGLESFLTVCRSWLLVMLILLSHSSEVIWWILLVVGVWLIRTSGGPIGIPRVIIFTLWGLVLVEEAVALLLVGQFFLFRMTILLLADETMALGLLLRVILIELFFACKVPIFLRGAKFESWGILIQALRRLSILMVVVNSWVLDLLLFLKGFGVKTLNLISVPWTLLIIH